jgi:hypothetical protein
MLMKRLARSRTRRRIFARVGFSHRILSVGPHVNLTYVQRLRGATRFSRKDFCTKKDC